MSAFEVTQAHGTAQLALLKVLVRSVCVLAIGLSEVGVLSEPDNTMRGVLSKVNNTLARGRRPLAA